MPNALPRVAEPDEHRTQFTDVFSTIHGHHSFKFGGDVNLVHEVMINLFQGGGVYNYSGATTRRTSRTGLSDAFRGQPGNTDPYAGYHYTSFVQTVDQINTGHRAGADDFWMKMFDGFAEDSWKVKSEPHRQRRRALRRPAHARLPSRTTPTIAPISTYYSSTIKNVTDRVQPRIGFSWHPYVGTVVRGGYGMFSALNQGSTYYAMRVENGVVQVNYNYTGCGPTCTQPTPGQRSLPVPQCSVPAHRPVALDGSFIPTAVQLRRSAVPPLLGAQSFHGLDPNFVPPLAHEAELAVEQALPGNMSLSVGYVGTRALRLPVFLDANLVGQTPHGSRTYNVLDANGAVTKQLTVPVYLSRTAVRLTRCCPTTPASA